MSAGGAKPTAKIVEKRSGQMQLICGPRTIPVFLKCDQPRRAGMNRAAVCGWTHVTAVDAHPVDWWRLALEDVERSELTVAAFDNGDPHRAKAAAELLA